VRIAYLDPGGMREPLEMQGDDLGPAAQQKPRVPFAIDPRSPSVHAAATAYSPE
jgi:hypothetical protein